MTEMAEKKFVANNLAPPGTTDRYCIGGPLHGRTIRVFSSAVKFRAFRSIDRDTLPFRTAVAAPDLSEPEAVAAMNWIIGLTEYDYPSYGGKHQFYWRMHLWDDGEGILGEEGMPDRKELITYHRHSVAWGDRHMGSLKKYYVFISEDMNDNLGRPSQVALEYALDFIRSSTRQSILDAEFNY